MTDSPDDRELADDAEALASELRELRQLLERQGPRPPRGPFGIPRPPTPREFMEFADEVAIPATIAVLETNIRLLQALQRAIRLAEGGRRARERGEEAGSSARSRVESVSRETLGRVSDALTDLQSVLEGTELPENEHARGVLQEARDLREEIQRQVDAARREDHTLDEYGPRGRDDADESHGSTPQSDSERGSTGAVAGDRDRSSENGDDRGNEIESDDEPVEIDVDAELETLKRRYGDDEDSVDGDDDEPSADGGATGTDRNGDDAGDDGSGGRGDAAGGSSSGGRRR
ncbi:DUF7547 family protein [Haloarchaeobius sp. DFWS5]|uniref:DUF7547 family protein n=1 Tax=Haloarchaeobius sp. DFWS5 TaxID=3446114 RepID=UPI003EBC81EF